MRTVVNCGLLVTRHGLFMNWEFLAHNQQALLYQALFQLKYEKLSLWLLTKIMIAFS